MLIADLVESFNLFWYQLKGNAWPINFIANWNGCCNRGMFIKFFNSNCFRVSEHNQDVEQYALVGLALLPRVEYWNRRQRSGTVPLLSVQCSASVNKGQGRGLLLGHNSGLPRPPRSVNRGHTQPGKIHISFTRHLLGNTVFPPIQVPFYL